MVLMHHMVLEAVSARSRHKHRVPPIRTDICRAGNCMCFVVFCVLFYCMPYTLHVYVTAHVMLHCARAGMSGRDAILFIHCLIHWYANH